MACCRPSTIAKAHLGSSAYTILIAKTCAQKQSVDARDVRYLATRAREALIYKEIASWAVRDAFPNGRRVGIRIALSRCYGAIRQKRYILDAGHESKERRHGKSERSQPISRGV